MADKRAKRIAEFIKPLRVKPGSKVHLGKDFDPGYKADFQLHEDAGQLARTSRARSRAAHQDGAAQAAAPVSPARGAATQNHPTQPSPRSARPRVKSQRGPRAAEGDA
jgi:hypothetical protein